MQPSRDSYDPNEPFVDNILVVKYGNVYRTAKDKSIINTLPDKYGIYVWKDQYDRIESEERY
jgi:hypothetical protein